MQSHTAASPKRSQTRPGGELVTWGGGWQGRKENITWRRVKQVYGEKPVRRRHVGRFRGAFTSKGKQRQIGTQQTDWLMQLPRMPCESGASLQRHFICQSRACYYPGACYYPYSSGIKDLERGKKETMVFPPLFKQRHPNRSLERQSDSSNMPHSSRSFENELIAAPCAVLAKW